MVDLRDATINSPEPQVQGGDDEQAEQYRGDQAPQDDDGHRARNLLTRKVAEDHQGKEGQRCQTPASKGRLQEEEDSDGGGDPENEQALLGILLLLVHPKHLCAVLEWKPYSLETLFDIAHHSAGIASAHVEAHIDATRDGFMLDQVRGWRDT